MPSQTRTLRPLAERDLERVRVALARLRASAKRSPASPKASDLRSPEDVRRAALRRSKAKGCSYDEARRELVNAIVAGR